MSAIAGRIHPVISTGDRYAHTLFGSGDRLESAAQTMAVVEAGIAW